MPQLQQHPTSLLAASPVSPSFNSYYTSYSSDDETLADVAARVVRELSGDSEFYSWEDDESADLEQQEEEEKEKENENIKTTAYCRDESSIEEEGEFEFAIVDREAVTSPISADEIFCNGQIRPLYPLFNTDLLLNGPEFQSLKSNSNNKSPPPPPAEKSRVGRRQPLMKLFREEREGGDGNSSQFSSEDELDSVPEGTYCVWNPKKEESSPEISKKKSSSDGSDSKRWKLFRDLIYRSNSEGNHKRRNGGGGNDDRRRRGGGGEKEVKAEDGREVRNVKESVKRQLVLPIRQDLVGVLSNVSGVSRNLHPF
ncbi:hypothetical protein LINPERPRIM_LOCUS36518 [Linum perenne]